MKVLKLSIDDLVDKIPLRGRKLVEYVFEDDVSIVPFGDVHLGSPDCNWDFFKSELEKEFERPNSYLVGMGDLIENALRDSVSDVYGQVGSPHEQITAWFDVLKPWAEAGRILGLFRGNHELRSYKRAGLKPVDLLCRMLDVPFFGDAQFMKVKCGNNNYHLYGLHGFSGATTLGGKLNALTKLAGSVDVDVYLMGHVHDLAVHKREVLRVNNRARVVEVREQFFVLTGHFLNYEGSYAQRKGYGIGRQGFPRVLLSSGDWGVDVEV